MQSDILLIPSPNLSPCVCWIRNISTNIFWWKNIEHGNVFFVFFSSGSGDESFDVLAQMGRPRSATCYSQTQAPLDREAVVLVSHPRPNQLYPNPQHPSWWRGQGSVQMDIPRGHKGKKLLPSLETLPKWTCMHYILRFWKYLVNHADIN